MDERIQRKDENVIFYPGIVKRLVEKGMDALKEKDGEKAYDLFLSAEELEPENPQVLFGKMLSLVELGRLKEAVQHTSQLLLEGIGDYFDTLQVHISLLVQLGKYEEVVEIITAVLSENRVPAVHAESFYQLLHFSRQMVESNEGKIEETIEDDQVEEAITMLESKSLEMQLKGIKWLQGFSTDEALKALVDFIETEDRDLALQSYALEILSEKSFAGYVSLEKIGRTMKVRPSELDHLYEMTFGQNIIHKLEEKLEQDNPMLFEFAKQLCWTYLFALYPFLPEPADENLWTAVFHYCAAKRIGIDEVKEIAKAYTLNVEQLLKKENEFEKIEMTVFQIHSFI